MEKDLSEKTILITGGSSRLGRAFVEKALERGARVFFTYYEGNDTARALEGKGAEGFCLDLGDRPAIGRFSEAIRGRIDSLDVLIHNAAAVRDGLIENMSEEDWDEVIGVNLTAPFYLSKLLLPLLFKKRPSKVFMITSRMGCLGAFGASNYAASKAGMIALAKTMAAELGRKEILVNAVNPGFMESKMNAGLKGKIVQMYLNASPLKKFSDPEEVAEFLVYLCSDQMKQVTGQVFHFESRKIPL